MPDDPSAPIPTPTNYQRTTGGHLRWQPPSAEHLQEMLPAYEIMSILGQGGMGAVYKGRQKSLDRIVAIKILPPEAAEDDMQFVERFKNEARTMAKMNHPAIVHVYDFGETSDGQLYIVMEFIDGTDVAKMISSKGKLPEDYSLSITAHVCDALQYAHTHGVVHRDIKPANILINMEGQVKVADFGLAKATDASQMGLTKTNMAMGTPDFVSPEALSPGTVVDGRADLYAVGVMLYNMLTGKVPRGAFRMPSSTQDTDARFDKIIGKAMEMDRENRYQTALDLRRDLDVILTAPMVKSGGQAQAAVPQQSLPQKPMGKSPGAPQPRKEAAPAAKPASKPAATPAPAKKSNAGMIYSIAAAVVVVAVAAFMFAGGGKKAVTATKPAELAKTQPQPAPSKATSRPAPKPVASVPVATAPVVKADEKWVDGLAQWFGGTKTNEGFIRKPGQAVRIAKFASMMPLPASAPLMRDMAVRATVRLGDGQETSEFRLSARAVSTTGNAASGYSIIIKQEERRVRLGCNLPGKPSQAFNDYKLPADFDFTAPHTLELRTVGDLLTVTLDGKKLGDRRDTQVTAGHPALGGSKAWIESFEYLDLDAGAAAPAAAYKLGDVFTFAGHRYQLVQEKLTWDSAKAKAEAMGGNLAVIMSQEEYDVIWDKVASKLKITPGSSSASHCYIGGIQRSAADGPWEWITGMPLAIQPWMGDFPNDKKSGTKVLSIYDKKGLDDVPLDFDPCVFLVEWDDDGTKKPAPLLTGPVNLLALVDLKRDAVKGRWEMTPEGLALSKTDGPQLLSLNHTAPEEYDFEIEFTLKEGIKEVGQILPLPTGLTMWKMGLGGGDPTSFCFGPNLDGKDANKDTARTEALVRRPRLSAGQRYRSVVEVRRGSLCALIDGKEILRWTGDPKRLSNSTEFALANPAQLGLASFSAGMIFHKAELRPAVPPPATTAPPLTAPVNLLALVDVKRDAVAGDWTMPADGLALAKGTFGALEFPAQVPVEYDFEMEFTPTTDGNNVNQYITAGGHSFAWKLNAHARTPPLYGFELLDGKFSKETTEARTEISQALKVGTRYRSTIEVRKGSLRALLDGEELVKWSGDFSRFSMEPGTKLHDPKHIGVGAYKRGVVFHKAELRPVVTGGAVAPQPPPGAVGDSALPETPMPAVTPAAPTDPRLAQLEAGYQARYDSDAQKPFLAAVAALNQSYIANGIARSRAAAQAKGSLAEVTALDAEKTAIEKGSGVPAEDAADTPESLKTLRGTYRTVLAKHTAERDAKAAPLLALYLKALDVYVTELTKAGKLDEAKQVQALRDAKAAPKPAAATPAPASAVTAADPAAPKMNEREVAEWMLSMGVEISVQGMSGIKDVAALPAGKITLTTAHILCDKTTNTELGCLAVCRDMTILSFRNQLPENGVINLEPIRRLTKLKSLTCYPPRDSTGMEIITGLKGLTQLTLGGTEAAALDQIAALKDLESLNFAAVTSPDFSALKACKKIRTLYLGGRPCIINDANVVALVATWPDLEHLTLGENNNPAPITDAALEELVKLKKLKELKLTETKVSEAALAKLQKALPDCKVTR